MRTLLALAISTLTTFAAPVPKELKQAPPRDRLQGRWVIVSMDEGQGQQVQTGDFADYAVRFEGDKYSSSYRLGPICQGVRADFDFDASPMRMTVSGLPYIIKIENGQLWKCHGQAGMFPTEFKGCNGSYCTVLKRVEK